MAVLGTGCQLRQREHFEQKPLKVTVRSMQHTESICRHTYVAEVEEQSSVALSMQRAGQVLRVAVKTGDKVQAGQLLMEVDSTQALSAKQAAEAILRQAEDGLARAMQVYREGGLTEQQRVDIETKLTQAKSLYETACKSVEDCRLTAPTSGVIGKVHATAGQNVVPGVTQMLLMNTESMRVRFAVPEMEIATIRIGDKAWVELPALKQTGLEAVVTEKSMIAGRLAHTYDVVATLKGDRVEVLSGMMAKVQLERDRIDGYVLPQSCVQILPDGAKVWVANGHTAARRDVKIGQYVAEGVLIVDGIHELDQVIIEGYQKLWQGAEITY